MEETKTSKPFLLGRKIDEKQRESHLTFSVLQWNTLSSELGTPDSFPKIDQQYLLPSYRQPLITHEITSYSPDFVCLEEVSKVDVEFFKAIFEASSHSCIYHEKYLGMDGLCFLYNQTKFELVKSDLQTYMDLETNSKQSQVFQLNLFKPKIDESTSNDYLMVIFTHLKAKAANTAVRLGQVKQLIKFIEESKAKVLEDTKGKNINLGIVICGDFNDEPGSDPLKYFSENINLRNAFEGEAFTTFKIRDKEYKRVIDYIFYSENLHMVGKSNIPSEEAIGKDGLPNANYPSDHLSLYCKLQF